MLSMVKTPNATTTQSKIFLNKERRTVLWLMSMLPQWSGFRSTDEHPMITCSTTARHSYSGMDHTDTSLVLDLRRTIFIAVSFKSPFSSL